MTVTFGSQTGEVLSVTPTTISVRVSRSASGNLQVVVTVGGRTAVGPALVVILNVAGTHTMVASFGSDFCDLLSNAEEDEFADFFEAFPWNVLQSGIQLTVTNGLFTWSGALSGNMFEARVVINEGIDEGVRLTFIPTGFTGVFTLIGKTPGHDPRCDFTINLNAVRTSPVASKAQLHPSTARSGLYEKLSARIRT